MQTIDSVTQIISIIATLKPGDWLVVDVDNTLIMPADDIFKSNSPDKNFIDNLKKQNPPNLKANLSKWRLKRKVQLVENGWPEILKIAKAKEVFVYALTQMDTGAYGAIASIENWRADELEKMDLIFSNYAKANVEILLPGKHCATIYKGIMFTGAYKKPETLAAFIAKHSTTPQHIVFVDDRLEQVDAINTWCNHNHIVVTACHYTACTKTTGTLNPKRRAIQLKSFATGDWLSDTEADAILALQQNRLQN